MQTISDLPVRLAAPLLFAVMLGAVSWHTYRYPLDDIDMLGYMANVVALETSNTHEIHSAVYSALVGNVPEGTVAHLVGRDGMGPQAVSLRDRANDPYHFVEFLPCFAIRPLYIEGLHIFRRLGVRLTKVTVLGAVLPYVALAILILLWTSRYVGLPLASLFAFLLAITPPILGLARYSGPDSLSTLWTCLALYLIFERRLLTVGLVFLLSSIYIRTDNALLAFAVIAYLSLITNELDRWKSAILGLAALGSVLTINHFAGDYGWRLLYYRGFIAAPLAPGEFVAHFSFADYEHALRSGCSALVNGNFIPYLLFGLIGCVALRKRTLAIVFAIVVAFSAAHFVIFPLVEDRYFSLFYVITGVTAISAFSVARKPATQETI